MVNSWSEDGHVSEVAILMEGEGSYYRGGQFNLERMVMLRRWSVHWRENDHVNLVSLMEGEWSSYKDGQFNEGIMMLLRWPINGENMVILLR